MIKLPAFYDLSHYKEVPDFAKIDPKPILIATKATESTDITDAKFIRFAQGIQSIGVVRGFYHFNRKAKTGYAQAKHFIETISKIDILPTDILILDVEEGGEKASELWSWFETVKKAFPDNRLWIYSTKIILNAIKETIGEAEYFKRTRVWTAGYPWFPDLFSTVPKSYIPDQSRWGEVVAWQYAKGKVNGIIGDADLNWINPDFVPQLESTIGEITMANYEGTAIQKAMLYKSAGGEILPNSLEAGTFIKADLIQMVAGINYFRLTYPVSAWTKVKWFTYKEVGTTPPPSPPPTTPVKTHTIDIFDNGSIKVDGNPIA